LCLAICPDRVRAKRLQVVSIGVAEGRATGDAVPGERERVAVLSHHDRDDVTDPAGQEGSLDDRKCEVLLLAEDIRASEGPVSEEVWIAAPEGMRVHVTRVGLHGG